MTVEHDILHNMAKVSRVPDGASELIRRARPPAPSLVVVLRSSMMTDCMHTCSVACWACQAITELEVAVSILRPELRTRDEQLLGMGKHDRKRAARDIKKQKELDKEHAGLGKNGKTPKKPRTSQYNRQNGGGVGRALVPRPSRTSSLP